MQTWFCLVWLWATLRTDAVLAHVDEASLNVTAVPECGLRSIVETVSPSGCSLTDFDCICANATLVQAIETRLAAKCTTRQALATVKWTKTTCGITPHDRSRTVWAVPAVLITLSTVFYTARVLSRYLVVVDGARAPERTLACTDLSDVVMGVCVLCTIPLLWSAFQLAADGLGKDVWDVPYDYIGDIFFLCWVDELLYTIITPLIRVSILLFYLEIFPPRANSTSTSTSASLSTPTYIRTASYYAIAANGIYLVSFVVATAVLRQRTVDAQGRHLGWAAAAANIALDIFVLVLPLSALTGLSSMTRGRKGMVSGMFLVGIFIIIISALRLASLVSSADTANPTYDFVQPGLYAIVEISTGIICGCLPAVGVLLAQALPKFFSSPAQPETLDEKSAPSSEPKQSAPSKQPTSPSDRALEAGTANPTRTNTNWFRLGRLQFTNTRRLKFFSPGVHPESQAAPPLSRDGPGPRSRGGKSDWSGPTQVYSTPADIQDASGENITRPSTRSGSQRPSSDVLGWRVGVARSIGEDPVRRGAVRAKDAETFRYNMI